MKHSLIEEKGIFLVPTLLALFIFFIPISPSLKSIIFVSFLIAFLGTPYYNRHLFYAYNTLWGRAALALFGCVLIACIWSPALYSKQLMVLEKYAKLLYLPILACGFINSNIRYWALNSYLAALFVTCVVSLLKYKNILPHGPWPGAVFYNHIVTGFMMAFACYLAGIFAFDHTGWRRAIYLFLVLIMSVQLLFVNTGRTGYVVYFILMIFLLIQKLSIKEAILSILLFSGMIAVVYQEYPELHSRVQNAVYEFKSFEQNNRNTSLGTRFQFHSYSKSLLAEHPIFGIGTAGFAARFFQDNPVPEWGRKITEPHSQYWMTLAEQGIVGMFILFFFLGSLFYTSFQLKETRPILLGLLLAFSVVSWSDTILCYSAAGYLLIVISALCFGEIIEKREIRGSCGEPSIKLAPQ